MIVCQACGAENADGATFCQKCATRLDVATQQSVVQRRAAHTATGLRWSAVLAAALVIVIVVLIILFVLGVL